MKIEQLPTPLLHGPSNGGSVSLQPILRTGPQGLPGPGSAAWKPGEVVTVGVTRQSPDGSWVKSTTNRTTGATYDATEQTFWQSINTYAGTQAQTELSATYVPLAPAPLGGGSDDTTALQAKLTAGSLRLRPNSTYLTTGLTVPAGFVLDLNGSTIKKHSGVAHLLTPAAGATVKNGTLDSSGLAGSAIRVSVADAILRDLSSINAAGGSSFDCTGATRPRLLNCSSDGAYYGILLSGATVDAQVVGGTHRNGVANTSYEGSVYLPNASRSRITGVTVENSAGHGFYDMGTDNTFVNCVSRNNGTTGAFDHRGVTTDGSTRSKWVGCDFIANKECGFYDRNTSTDTILQGCTAVGNNTALRPGGHGFEMLGTNYTITACFSRGQLGNTANAGCGFYLGRSGQLAGCHSTSNWAHGYSNFDALRTALTGCTASNNGQAGTGIYDGFNSHGTSAGSTKNLTMTGCNAYDTQVTKTQRYGCAISANTDYYTVTGNIFRTAENATGGLSDGASVNKVVANNLTA